LRRLINRHVEAKNGNGPACEALAQQLTSALTPLLQAMWHTHQDLAGAEDVRLQTPFELFTNLLLLARFIAMEGRV
jgi:hypothetical protein